MTPIVDKEDIIKTFSRRECEAALAYLSVKGTPLAHLNEAHAATGLRKGRIRDWLIGSRKPVAIKIVEDLEARGLLPLLADGYRLPLLARIVGGMFGDGSLTRTHPHSTNLSASFSSNDPRAIKAFFCNVERIFGQLHLSISQYEHESKYGKSIMCEIRTSSACRLLACLGVPIGDKVSQSISIPAWISAGTNKVKINFLDGLLSSELSNAVPQKHSHVPQMFRFSMSKVEKLTKNHIVFLDGIRSLLAELGVESSEVFLRKNIRNRRDGQRSFELAFHITNSRENLANFFNLIPLTYAPAKRESLRRIMMNDPCFTFEGERAIYAPRTKINARGNGGTTTVPSVVRRSLDVKIHDKLLHNEIRGQFFACFKRGRRMLAKGLQGMDYSHSRRVSCSS